MTIADRRNVSFEVYACLQPIEACGTMGKDLIKGPGRLIAHYVRTSQDKRLSTCCARGHSTQSSRRITAGVSSSCCSSLNSIQGTNRWDLNPTISTSSLIILGTAIFSRMVTWEFSKGAPSIKPLGAALLSQWSRREVKYSAPCDRHSSFAFVDLKPERPGVAID